LQKVGSEACRNLQHHAVAGDGGTNACYESKFILDSFLFRVSPAKILRRLAANVDFSTRSRVFSDVSSRETFDFF
jgi:hypothetical protein